MPGQLKGARHEAAKAAETCPGLEHSAAGVALEMMMVTFAGGYAQKVEDTVTIHCNTILAAKEVFGS